MTPGIPQRTRSRSRAVDERTFHRWLASHLPAGRSGPLPLGDDAAALHAPPGCVVVLSTDALVEGTHFLPESPPRAIGSAAAAVSLSDVAAKGARPAGLLLDLLVPRGTPERWLRDVALGAEEMVGRFGAHLVGGDTKPSPVPTVVGTIVAWGDPRQLVPRSGARPGDRLAVTGRVGQGGLAWRQYRVHPRRRASLAMLLKVEPRVREGQRLARRAHAMVDTSDGLADAAHLMGEASQVKIVIDERRIPWAADLEHLPRAQRIARGLFGGDYELLAALPGLGKEEVAPVRGAPVTVIGRVEPGAGAFLTGPHGPKPLPRAGWQPFTSTSRSRI